jgi:hypothetical protein
MLVVPLVFYGSASTPLSTLPAHNFICMLHLLTRKNVSINAVDSDPMDPKLISLLDPDPDPNRILTIYQKFQEISEKSSIFYNIYLLFTYLTTYDYKNCQVGPKSRRNRN